MHAHSTDTYGTMRLLYHNELSVFRNTGITIGYSDVTHTDTQLALAVARAERHTGGCVLVRKQLYETLPLTCRQDVLPWNEDEREVCPPTEKNKCHSRRPHRSGSVNIKLYSTHTHSQWERELLCHIFYNKKLWTRRTCITHAWTVQQVSWHTAGL